jgi:NAD(P)-dependent dehydrogenase (short-subunit alcohol dehydrogenase family)
MKKLTKFLAFGSSSPLALALSKLADFHFVGRTNPYGFKNFIKIVGYDKINDIQELIQTLENKEIISDIDMLHVVFLQGVSSSDWALSINVNFLSVALISEYLGKKIKKQNIEGSFTLIGSASSNIGGKMTYCSTKSALNGVMASLNKNFSPNIRTNIVIPGAFEGNMIRDWDSEKRIKVSKNTFSNRLGSPDEISNAIFFCIKNNYLSGSKINITNGQIK